jgi:hypothetical protein
MTKLFLIGLCVAAGLLNAGGVALIKTELLRHALAGPMTYVSLFFTVRVIVGWGALLCAAVAMVHALSVSSMATVVPLTMGINFTATVLLSKLFLSEPTSVLALAGMAVILVGMAMVGFEARL